MPALPVLIIRGLLNAYVQKVEMSFYTSVHKFNLVIFTLCLVWFTQWMARKTKVIIYIEMEKCIDN